MQYFGKFYLDKEKDIIVTLFKENHDLYYEISTPNHASGNLITNLASLCHLDISFDTNGLKVIRGRVPGYIDGEGRFLWILRLADTKTANIYPDGTIDRKAYIPAIAKTFMSQTKEYHLSANKTLVKTYIREECKFHTDLHTHMNANLSPDILIAMGIAHQIRYPYYYIKKLHLKITDKQREKLEKDRSIVAETLKDSSLKGKYLERRINDNTFINFADLILNNLEYASYNIPKIRASLAVMKDGQAVFTNLEKVYLYRYVFTKGIESDEKISFHHIDEIPDTDIVNYLHQMLEDRKNPDYQNNSLYQDELLWIARSYAHNRVYYAEISDTSLVKKKQAAHVLKEIHEVMPAITKETGVTLRFLAAFRRIPLTIVKDQIENNYFTENLQVLKAVAKDPYIAGSDFVGEEINDIRELKPVIHEIVKIASDIPSFVIRIHAGENDSLPDNVANSILCVRDSLSPGQKFPCMRIGHGLYTANLNTKKGRELIGLLLKYHVVLEFQITSNVRLNNLNSLQHHPLKQYLKAGIACVQGTDGGALYGTDSIDEQLSLERMLDLDFNKMCQMADAEKHVMDVSIKAFKEKNKWFEETCHIDIQEFYQNRIHAESEEFLDVSAGERKYDSSDVFKDKISLMPVDKVPVIIAGGSFNNASHMTKLRKSETKLIDDLLTRSDPDKVFFVIGPSFKGYEKYLLEHNHNRFDIWCFVPSAVTKTEWKKIQAEPVHVRVSIEASAMGCYKSFAYEIFKRRESVIVAFDGNSIGANLIQDAKNSKYKSRTFISVHSRSLMIKAKSLEGYITYFDDKDNADEMIRYCDKYYADFSNPDAMILKKKKVYDKI